MSILLDALKKSEAQRRLGGKPSIHSAVDDSVSLHSQVISWLPPTMLILSAVVIAWLGWAQYSPPNDGETEPAAPMVSTSPATEKPVTGQDATTVNVRTPVEQFDAQQSARSVSDQGPGNDREADEDRRERLRQSLQAYESEPARDVLAAVPKAVEGEPADDRQSPGSKEPQPDDWTRAESAPGLSGSPKQPSRVQPVESEPISYWQIPQGMREDLPELRITVLVYANDPEDRFVLINGQRVVEKEELIDGLVLDQIRRDGAVFKYRNYRFLVKG